MSQQARLWIAAAIIALLVVTGFALSVPHTRDIQEAPTASAPASVPLVTLRDTFKKGVHTITGSLPVPNACIAVSAEATSTAEGILIDISAPSDEGVCLQLPTTVSFQTTLAAPAHLPFTVRVNGSVATTSMP